MKRRQQQQWTRAEKVLVSSAVNPLDIDWNLIKESKGTFTTYCQIESKRFRPARGIATSLVIGAVCWGLLYAAIYFYFT